MTTKNPSAAPVAPVKAEDTTDTTNTTDKGDPMTCPNSSCGKMNAAGSKFCSDCGTPMNTEKAAAAAPIITPTAATKVAESPVVAAPVAATFAELDTIVPAATPGRDGFITACQRKGLTVSAAQTELVQHVLNDRNEKAARVSDLEKVNATPGIKPIGPGADGAGGRSASSGDHGMGPGITHEQKQRARGGSATGAFYDKVAQIKAARNCSQADAIKAVQKEFPDLRKAYQDECTARSRSE